MTRRDFIRRCKALGAKNPHAASKLLGMEHSHVYRIWIGERKVGPYVQAALERAEREWHAGREGSIVRA